MERSLTALKELPDAIELYEVWARASLHCDGAIPDPGSLSSISHALLAAMRVALFQSMDSKDELEVLRQSAVRFDVLSIGMGIYGFYLRYLQLPLGIRGDWVAELAGYAATPRTSLLYDEIQNSKKFLDKLNYQFPKSPTVILFKELTDQIEHANEEPFSFNLPIERNLKYRALVLERIAKHNAANDTYRELSKIAGNSPTLINDALKGLYRCAYALRNLVECIGIVVDTYIDGKNLFSAREIEKLLSDCKNIVQLPIANDPSMPILHLIASRQSSKAVTDQDIFECYDDFLESANAATPMDLESQLGMYQQQRIVCFLREVCVPEIMDSSVAFEGTQALENQRVSICQLLRKIDPENSMEYAVEISELQKRAAIRGAIRSADSSKIYIDTGGIKASFDESFRESFARYRKIQQLAPEQRRLLPDDLRAILVVTDESLGLFTRIFADVKNRFISSDQHGLDSYLSVRIRHGTLAGQIRTQFERHRLVTRRDAMGLYEINQNWTDSVYPYLRSKANRAFTELATAVDSAIEEVKSEWVQIRAEENPRGFFDFEYDDKEIAKLWFKTAAIAEFDEFIDDIFDELWERTERGLANLRSALVGPLNERLTTALDEFETSITTIFKDSRSITHEITECRTAVQNELNSIAEWFRRGGESSVEDFEPEFAVEAALEIVSNTFSRDALAVELEGESENQMLIRGSAFPAFLDILYILLENIIRHAGGRSVATKILLGNESGALTIEVVNEIGADTDAADLQRRIPEFMDRANSINPGTVIRQEGGTGFYKLGKILGHDLDCSRRLIDVSLDKNRHFHVKLLIDLGEDRR